MVPEDRSDGALRLLLIDACSPFRDGLRAAWMGEEDIRVVGDAGSIAEALPLAQLADFDVAFVDACLPDGSGVELCGRLMSEHPGSKVIVLSLFDWDVYLAGAWQAGAAGFIAKTAGPRSLRLVAHRARLRRLYSADQLQRVMEFQQHVGERLSRLGDRERVMMRLLALGLSNRQMGERLGLSENTIEKRVSSLLESMHARSRKSLLSLILRYRIEVLEEPDEGRETARDWWWVPVPMALSAREPDALTDPLHSDAPDGGLPC